jgi:hypothetical protein
MQIMTRTYVSSITIFRSARAEKRQVPAMRVYRISKSFAAVHFEQTGKGRIVFLPQGAKLSVVGSSSCLCEGLEVMYERQFYNIFKADLLGPWCNPMESGPIETRQDIPAVGAYA